jgi:uncharacterized protein YggE
MRKIQSFYSRHQILLIILILFLGNALHAQEPVSNQIVSEGLAKTKIKPDLVTFTLTVQKNDNAENTVIEKLNEEVETLAKALHQIGITDSSVKIADYNLSKDLNDPHKIRYTGSNTLRIELPFDPELINRLYNQIQESKFSDVDLSFETSLSDHLERNTRAKLVDQAIADAKANAENIAKALNLKIVSVKQVYKGAFPLTRSDEIEMSKYTPPKVVKDETVIANTSFAKFQVVDVELDEKITVIFGISQSDYR